MKRLLTLVAFFATLGASAQQVNPVPDYVFANRMSAGRNTVTDTAAYFSIGPRYGATRGMMPPMVVDTASFSGNKRNGLLIFSVQKNKFLYWDSVGVKWAEMAGTGGSAITGSGVVGYMPEFTTATNLDTTRLYHSAGRFAIGSTTTSNGVLNVYGGQSYFDTSLKVGSQTFLADEGKNEVYINTSGDSGAYALQIGGGLYNTTGAVLSATSGNVGIGKVATEKLDVLGNGLFSGTLTAANGLASRRTTDAVSATFFRSTIDGSSIRNNGIIVGKSDTSRNSATLVYTHTSDGSTSNRLGIGFWGFDNLYNFTASGFMGIGTTNPTHKLQVNGSSAGEVGSIISIDTASTTSFLRLFGDVGSQNLVNWQDGTSLRFATSNQNYSSFAERLRINSAGELLIATSSDQGDYKIQINGNSLFSGNIRTAAPAGGTANDWRLGTVATVSPTSPNRTIEVSIGGTIYYIAAKTTND